MLKHRRLVAALGCLTAVGGAGIAVAADGATDIKVTAAPTLSAGQTAPFDARRRRRPSAAASRSPPATSSSASGRHPARREERRRGADLPLPEGKTLRTFGIVGNAGFSPSTATTPATARPPSMSFAAADASPTRRARSTRSAGRRWPW